MRCYICDVTLSAEEVRFNKDHDKFDPCSSCLAEINEVFGPLTDDEVDEQLALEFGDEMTENPT